VDEKSKQLLRQTTRHSFTARPCAKEITSTSARDPEHLHAVEPKVAGAWSKSRAPRQTGLCLVRQTPGGERLRSCSDRSSGAGQPQHALSQNLCGCAGKAAATALFAGDVSLHAQTCELVEHGRDRIGIMDRQCTGQRIATAELLQTEVQTWQQQRNAAKRA